MAPGDVVRLKSGGSLMVIEGPSKPLPARVRGGVATPQWVCLKEVRGATQRETFPEHVLEADPDTGPVTLDYSLLNESERMQLRRLLAKAIPSKSKPPAPARQRRRPARDRRPTPPATPS